MAPLSEEEENYVRLALLLKGVTPRAVRTYFDREFVPTSLPSTLKTSYNTLADLKLKRIINQAQWNLLIPRNGVPDSKTFDVTLMVCLIRHLTSIISPINGFDSLPLPVEASPGSDLARIKFYRNRLAHHDSNTIDTAYFNTAWTDISDAVVRLGGQTMYQECQELKVKVLDQSNQEIISEIQQSLEEIKELRQTMDNFGIEHSKVTENLRELQTFHCTLRTEHSNVIDNLRELQTSHNTLRTQHSNVTDNLRELQTSHSTLQTEHSKVTENLRELQTSHNTLRTEHSHVTDNLRELQTSYSTLQTENSKVSENVKTLQTELSKATDILKDPIPPNIRDQIQIQIHDWEKEDKMFVTTRASDYVIECLQDNSCLTLTGPSGVGKSFIARHTALVLQKEGYTIIPVRKPDDIRDYYQPGKQTVFIVDDICGNFTASQQQIENWQQLLPEISKIIADKCKIIVSCRLQVYKDDKFNILVPFKSCECNLMSDKLCLTDVEKNTMANTYFGSSLDSIDELSHNSEFFPLLCYLFHRVKHGDVKEFFKNPFIVYKNELDSLNRYGVEGKLKICSLALMVIFNNQLTDKWFNGKVTDEQRYILEDTCEACGLNRTTSKLELKEAINTLDGTFVYKQNDIYKTVHDKLFDFLAHYFGQKMIECLIDHGDSDLVHERFIWRHSSNDKNSKIEFIIGIPDEYLESYLRRFIQDWSAGKVRVVFENNNMTVSLFRQQLLQYLKQLDKSQQEGLVNTQDTVLPKEHHGSGNTPLIGACYYAYTAMVEWMLHSDVDVNQGRDDGFTGLIFASGKGHTDIVKLLLQRNANINQCNNNGWSPLRQACTNGHTDIVKLLLDSYPNINLCEHIFGRSTLYMACQNGHTEIVKLLLEMNPNVDLCDNDSRSPLYIASLRGYTEIVKLLLERNPNVDICDNDGFSPLYMASLRGQTEIVKLLLKRNPNIDLCDKTYGTCPLYMASQEGHTEIVKLLLGSSPAIDLCDNIYGCSPLFMASQVGHTDIVKLLLGRNPNIDLCDKCGRSPLRQASMYGHTDIVKLLLKMNPNIDLCDNDGCSPLYMASQYGQTNIVKLLLERDPDIDLCDNNECSPLNIANHQGHTDIVKLLLERNPKIDLCDNNGCSPPHIVNHQGYTDALRVLSYEYFIDGLYDKDCFY